MALEGTGTPAGGNNGAGDSGAPSPSQQGGSAPIGAEPVSGPSRGQASQTPGTSTEARSFGDDDLVRTPSGELVKYGDLHKRMQGGFTRKQQEWARQRDAERAELDALRQHNERISAELLRARGPESQPSAPGQDPASQQFLSALAKVPQVSGAQMAQILTQIRDEGFGTFAKAITDRDTILSALYREIQTLKQGQGQVSQERAQVQFDARIDGWLKDLGLDPEYRDLAIETYLAHEGPDLDEEFPAILQARIEKLDAIARKREQARLNAARNSRFTVPGKGGSASASKPLQLSGRESAKQQTDLIWAALQAQDGMQT